MPLFSIFDVAGSGLAAQSVRLNTTASNLANVQSLAGDPAQTGKDALADLRQGKLTWPFLVALEREPSLRDELERLLQAEEPDAAPVVERVLALGGVEATRRFAAEEGARALAELARLPSGWPRWVLEAVVQAVVERSR